MKFRTYCSFNSSIIYGFIIYLLSSYPAFVFSDEPVTSTGETEKKGRTERKLGDIFLGFKVAGGVTDMMNKTIFSSVDTEVIDKRMYFYNLAFVGEFYLASFVSIVLDYGLHSLRYDQKTLWQDGPTDSSQEERFFEQWFNRLSISSRFLFWDVFYIQTGPSILINYNASGLGNFMGIPPDVNDNRGVSLQWLVGLGASTVVGFKKNGDPLMSIDAGFYTYIPIVGNIIDNQKTTNAGGVPIRVKAQPYQFELNLSFTFLV